MISCYCTMYVSGPSVQIFFRPHGIEVLDFIWRPDFQKFSPFYEWWRDPSCLMNQAPGRTLTLKYQPWDNYIERFLNIINYNGQSTLVGYCAVKISSCSKAKVKKSMKYKKWYMRRKIWHKLASPDKKVKHLQTNHFLTTIMQIDFISFHLQYSGDSVPFPIESILRDHLSS